MAFAFVTGAARGIGAAIARALARDGYDVAINCRSSAQEAELVAEQCREQGVRAEVLMGDVADHAACEGMVKLACERLGEPHVLVNNAGLTRDGLLVRMKEPQFDEVISVNLKGSYNMMRLLAPMLMKRRSGRIINITSVTGMKGNPGQVNYAAAKAGLIGMALSAAKELGSRGVTVNCVAPGFTETDMTDALPATVREAALERITLGRFAKAEEIAEAVAFLASDRAGYITGQTLVVDGGLNI